MNGLNKYGYTNEQMSVNGGNVKDTEIPLFVVDHTDYGRYTLTADGSFFWLRFARPVPHALQAQLKEMNWWYSDKGVAGRKGFWTDTTKNALAVDALEMLGLSELEIPDITRNVRVKATSERKAKKQEAHVAKAKVSRGEAVPVAQQDGTVIPVATAPDGRVFHGVHKNKAGRWCDADGKLVPNAAIPQVQVTSKASKPTHRAAQPVQPVQPVQAAPKQDTQDEKIALLKEALEMQQAILAAIQALA